GAEGVSELEVRDRIHPRRDLAFGVAGDVLPGRALSGVLDIVVAALDPLIHGKDRGLPVGRRDLQLEAEVLFVRVDEVARAGDLDARHAVEDEDAVQRQVDALEGLHRVTALADDGSGIQWRRGRLRQNPVQNTTFPDQEDGRDRDSQADESTHRRGNGMWRASLLGEARPAGRRGCRWIRRGGTRIRDAGGPSQPRDHSNAIRSRHAIYALVTRLLQRT